MSAIYVAVAAGTLVTGYMGSKAQKDAANTAATAQTEAAQAGIAEQQREFDYIQNLLSPYVQAGVPAVQQQGALAGTQGPAAQQAAILALEQSPYFQSMTKQGENAILQNAAATGGLRGGNVQAALAQFRPKLLSNAIQQQFQNLGSLSNTGQSSAAGVGAAGQSSTSAITSLLQQIGQAQAGNAMAQGQAAQTQANTTGNVLGILGTGLMSGAF